MKVLLRKALLLGAGLFMTVNATAQNAVKDSDPINDIMFQSFGWDEQKQDRMVAVGGLYNFYKERASYMSEAGIDMVWLPPPSASTGGVGYIPTQLFDFSQTSWGKEAELTGLLDAYNNLGMYPVADIVVNHRGGKTNWMDFANPAWDCSAVTSNDEASGPGNTSGIKPCGNADTGTDFPGGRDLDHTNSQVQEGVKEYLSRLKGLGFKGWRWDVAKGFSPQYFGDYNRDSEPYYSVGEYWDGNANNLKNWVDGTGKDSGAFDFANYYQMSSAVKYKNYGVLDSGGKMPGLAGYQGYDGLSVTFVDNHDTFTSDDSYVDNYDVMQGYAYILTHPGIPCVWAAHYFGGTYTKDDRTRTYTDHQDEINKIMAVRKQNKINAYSAINIVESGSSYAAYVSPTYGSEATVAVKLGSGNWSPGNGWVLNASGNNYAVWSKVEVQIPNGVAEADVTIGLVGAGINGLETDWSTDIMMTSTDNKNYELKNQTLAGGPVKFRANEAWTLNWGGEAFPAGTGVVDGPDNIEALPGTYDITFNRETGKYNFVSVVACICSAEASAIQGPVCANGVEYETACKAECAQQTYTVGACPVVVTCTKKDIGIIGTVLNADAEIAWKDDVDMCSEDGVTYTLTYELLAGQLKFRANDDWPINWGSAAFPTGTGLQDGDNVEVPEAGAYDITFNRNTGAYTFEKNLSRDDFNFNADAVTINVYPNPSASDWNVTSAETINSIKVVDSFGKQIIESTPDDTSAKISGANLSAGLYFAIISTTNSVRTIKLLKK